MKVTFLTPGTGGTFYCTNCLRDVGLVRGLRAQGAHVTMVPVYLPILLNTEDVTGDTPVFFGGINVYLQQKYALFRKTPRWLDRWLDAMPMLKFAAAREGSTEAAGLGPLTLSMLEGAHGNQRKELDRLLAWLEEHEKPDVVHLSNALLLGMAGELKQRLGVSVVCSLQDEEDWLDGIDPPYNEQCWQAIADKAGDIDAFIPVSQWYGDVMQRRLNLDPSRLHVVPLGIELDERPPAQLPFGPPVIGYLSKLSASLGLDKLVEAFLQLKQHPELGHLKLRATGGQHGPDAALLRNLKQQIAKQGFEGDVEFCDDFDLEARRDFLRSLTVMSVPAPRGEAFGMEIIESLAEGVPVVMPNVGAYPEVVEATQGGLIYDANESGALAAALESLLLDSDRARDLGNRGREAVRANYGVDIMAEGVARVYRSLL